jgi:curved DNA-binding protein
MNHYETLGVSKTSSADDIKTAYKELAKKYHPDNKDTGSDTRMKEINSAYEVLKNPTTRAQYDAPQQHTHQTNNGYYSHRYTNVPEDILRDIFPNGDMFAQFFHAQQPRPQTPQKNKDVNISLQITIKEAFFGCEKLATIKEGTQTKTLSVVVPKGVRNGMKLRLKAQAPRTNLNLPAGDLMVHLNIHNQPDMAIVENNLVSIIEISALDALLGGKIEYTNIDDEVIEVDITEGTRHTEYINVKTKGMTCANSDHRGDLLLQVQTTLIKDLPQKLRKRLKKINDELKNINK